MTNEEMLHEMRSKRGFRQFGPSKVQRMFGLHYNRAVEWIEWLVGFGLAERIDDRPWEVRLL